jgi:hypothetical protein
LEQTVELLGSVDQAARWRAETEPGPLAVAERPVDEPAESGHLWLIIDCLERRRQPAAGVVLHRRCPLLRHIGVGRRDIGRQATGGGVSVDDGEIVLEGAKAELGSHHAGMGQGDQWFVGPDPALAALSQIRSTGRVQGKAIRGCRRDAYRRLRRDAGVERGDKAIHVA